MSPGWRDRSKIRSLILKKFKEWVPSIQKNAEVVRDKFTEYLANEGLADR